MGRGSGFSDPILGGGGGLVREAMKSPNYVLGVDGWIIRKDGSAEFNDVVVRGDLQSADYASGTDGWRLEYATGSAEFNNVTVRGAIEASTIDGSSITGTDITGGTITGATLRTAATGTRIAIGVAGVNFLQLYHGDPSELAPGLITEQRALAPNHGLLAIQGPKQNAGTDPPLIYLRHDDAGTSYVQIDADQIQTIGQLIPAGDVNGQGNITALGQIVATSTIGTTGGVLQVLGLGVSSIAGPLTVGGAVTLPNIATNLVSGYGDGTWVAGTWYSMTAAQNWSPANAARAYLVVVKIRDNGVGSPERTSTGCALISPCFWNALAGGRQIVSVSMDRHNNATPLTIDLSAAPGPGARALQARPSVTFTTSGGGAFEVSVTRLI